MRLVLCVLILSLWISTANAFVFTDNFVFQSIGPWHNFVYPGVTSITRVANNYPVPQGYTEYHRNTYGGGEITFSEGIDFEIDYSGSRIKLLSTAKTIALVEAYTSRASNTNSWTQPRIYVTANFSGTEYKPSFAAISSATSKLPRWSNKLKTASTLRVMLWGDSTVAMDLDSENSRWYNRWADYIKSKYPNISQIIFGFAAQGGHSSVDFLPTGCPDPDLEIEGPCVDSFINDASGVLLYPGHGLAAAGDNINLWQSGFIPDLCLVAYINDISVGLLEPSGTIGYLIQQLRTTSAGYRPMLPNIEFALISGEVTAAGGPSAETIETYRVNLKALSDAIPGVAFVDATTLWYSLFANKPVEEVLANYINHANSMSTIAYAYELQTLIALPSKSSPTKINGMRPKGFRVRIGG